jgi:hypothetical protein
MSSLVTSAICIILGVLIFYLLDKKIDGLVRTKIKDERSALYTVDNIRTFALGILLAVSLAIFSGVGELNHHKTFIDSYLIPGARYVAIFIIITSGIKLFYVAVKYLFIKDKEGYLGYLKMYTQRLYRENHPVIDNTTLWGVIFLITLSLPILSGSSMMYSRTEYDVINTNSSSRLQVVIGNIDTTLVVKEYDTQTHKFLDGYSLIDGEGKTFHPRTLKVKK